MHILTSSPELNNLKKTAGTGLFLCIPALHSISTSCTSMCRSGGRISLAALLLISIPLSSLADETYSATYRLEADGFSVGKLERSLEQIESGSFILKTKSYITGFWALLIKDRANEESHFAVVDGKTMAQSYHYQKVKKGKHFEEIVSFDSVKETIVSSSSDGKQSFPFTGVESDKLLYQFRIRQALKKGIREGGELQFSVVDRTRIRPYQFKVRNLEILETEMGTLKAVRVERINEEKLRKTTLWFGTFIFR